MPLIKKKNQTKLQCNPDIREIFSGPKLEPVLPKQNRPKPDIREIFSGPKLEPVLPKQNRPKPDIREIFSCPKLEPVLPKQNRPKPDIRDFVSGSEYSLISGLHCFLINFQSDLFQ